MKTMQEALNNVIKELEDKNPEAKKKILDCIEIDSWCDINMWGHE